MAVQYVSTYTEEVRQPHWLMIEEVGAVSRPQ